jgi:hypothetical protein
MALRDRMKVSQTTGDHMRRRYHNSIIAELLVLAARRARSRRTNRHPCLLVNGLLFSWGERKWAKKGAERGCLYALHRAMAERRVVANLLKEARKFIAPQFWLVVGPLWSLGALIHRTIPRTVPYNLCVVLWCKAKR